jgi:serine/threonine-protein kinase
MEFVLGSSLKSVVRADAPLEPARAIDFALQILEATRFSHSQGITHGDLKSANVIVDARGTAKVADFGIASTGARGMTPAGSILGTVEYMSPERLMGEPGTEACDVYSIGIILYELLTGRLPFDHELVPTVALKHLGGAPVPPADLNPAITPGLSAIILRHGRRPRRIATRPPPRSWQFCVARRLAQGRLS